MATHVDPDNKDTWPIVDREELKAFVIRCMESVGTKTSHAEPLAELIMSADYRGHYSHGLNRLDMYEKDMTTEFCNCDHEPEILHEKGGTAWVEGHSLLGPVVGKFCIDLAIKKAKENGIGMVVAKGSNHFGIAGWYSIYAQKQGFVGMAFTNTSPFLVPTGGRQAKLGTNPISMAASGKNGDSFVLDMATTTVAQGKIELAMRKEIPIPNGWGCDERGVESHDPKVVLDAGNMYPLGGTEECGGYKGYGLSMMVDVFCGILAGGAYGSNIRTWIENDREANLGQCFIAIDPGAFAPGFTDRMQDQMDNCRNCPTADGYSEVMIPGDPEAKHMKMCEEKGGIPYHPNQIQFAVDLAKRLKVDPLKTK